MKKKIKCFVCHKEINEEEDYVFMGKTVHKGECLKSMIDEYNAVRNLQIRNKRLCAEIKRLNNIINELEKDINKRIERYDVDETINGIVIGTLKYVLNKLQELKGNDNENNK